MTAMKFSYTANDGSTSVLVEVPFQVQEIKKVCVFY